MIMEKNPHKLIEGVIITSYACRISAAFIYVRGELALAGRQIEQAIEEAYAAGYICKNILGRNFSLDAFIPHTPPPYTAPNETSTNQAHLCPSAAPNSP